MMENYRTGLLWELVMQDQDVQDGLDKLGFRYQVPTAAPVAALNNDFLLYPNPAGQLIHITLPDAVGIESAVVKIYSAGGQLQMTKQLIAGSKDASVKISGLQNGHYIVQLIHGGKSYRSKFVVSK